MPPKEITATERKKRRAAARPYRIVEFHAYVAFAVTGFLGYVRDWFRHFIDWLTGRYTYDGFAPIVRDYDDFYQRRLFRRVSDAYSRPIQSRPSRVINVMERTSNDGKKTFKLTGKLIPCVNMGSYNYLGFADNCEYATTAVLESIDTYGLSTCSPLSEGGWTGPLRALEQRISRFLEKDDAVVCGMGFATNFSGIPALFCRETLVLSDSLNHASLVAGVRLSAGRVKVFPHNDMVALENIIRSELVDGQPRTHLRYKRAVVLVEGVYSMEGDIADLKGIVELKHKYRLQIFLDEAHSIGAMGKTGRGVCEHCGISPSEVDILMGTFTKSFGSIGGYIAGDQKVIDYVRSVSSFSTMAEALPPVCAQQALSTLEVICGEDGTDLGKQRLQQLADNTKYLRDGLGRIGVTVFGDGHSPVVPVLFYSPGRVVSLTREFLANNLAVVIVGYPATPLTGCRMRLCVSAAHRREDLDHVLRVLDFLVDGHGSRFERYGRMSWYDFICMT